MIEARNIIVQIGKRRLLNDVSATVKSGEILAVVGANGAGKSSLLKVLSGELRPQCGHVSFDGKPLSTWRTEEIARRRGVLPQNSALAFPFTAFEVVLLGRTPHVFSAKQRRDIEIAEAALKLVEVEQLAQRDFRTLSGGEQQRVSLARVLAQIWDRAESGAERYLLLDEPTASLDLQHQHQTLQIARKFADDGTTVLCVLHDLNLAALNADKILILQNGQVFNLGAPAEVLTAEMIRTVFGVEVVVTKHPYQDAPLIVPIGQTIEKRAAAKA